MKQTNRNSDRQPHLVWVYAVPIFSALDSATWLQTTQELRNSNWRVTLIAKGPSGEHQINGVSVICLSTIQKYFLGQLIFHLRIVLFLLRNWQTVDIVLFHQISVPWLLPVKLLRLLQNKRYPLFVMDTRDLNVVEDNFRNRLRMVYFNLTHQIANWWADGQTAITPRMADLVKIPQRLRWGFWPSGVNLERFAKVQEQRKWPTAQEVIHLMYVGKLHHGRNLLPICHAVQQANAQGALFSLTFVGSGSEQERLEAFAAQSAGSIKVLPPVSHELVPTLLRQAHIGVTSLPAPGDRHFEASSPIKLFEYMAAGLPILSTRNVCHTDVVGAGDYAFWAEDATVASLLATLTAINAAKLDLERRGEAAQEAVKAWSWQTAGQQLDLALSARRVG